MTYYLGVDPGSTESAYALIDDNYQPIAIGKAPNNDVKREVVRLKNRHMPRVAIEMVASYGMPVGREVFETCVWVGRFYEALAAARGADPKLVYRHHVKLHHCASARAGDSNITQALVDRFAPGTRNHGKGTKAEPGWFYGFKADIWAAYALAVYVADRHKGRPGVTG